MEQKTFYFDKQSIIVAYKDNVFAGLIVMYPGKTFTKTELLDFFEDTHPTYLIAADLPELNEEITPNNYYTKFTDLICELCKNNQSNLDVNYYIPRTLH